MITKNIKAAVCRKNGFLIFSSAGILSFIAMYLLTVATTAGYSMGIFVMMNGFYYAIFTLFMSAILSVLLGMYASLLAWKLELSAANSGRAGAAGIASLLVGIVGTGCPMCGSVILGLFGVPLGLLLLPFRGLELKAAGIILLSASVLIMAKATGKCKMRG